MQEGIMLPATAGALSDYQITEMEVAPKFIAALMKANPDSRQKFYGGKVICWIAATDEEVHMSAADRIRRLQR